MNKPDKITKEWVRENLPECTALADELRDLFGDNTTCVSMVEGDLIIGNPSKDASLPYLNATDFLNAGTKSRANTAYVNRERKRGGQ